jgi:hypothetical protein
MVNPKNKTLVFRDWLMVVPLNVFTDNLKRLGIANTWIQIGINDVGQQLGSDSDNYQQHRGSFNGKDVLKKSHF